MNQRWLEQSSGYWPLAIVVLLVLSGTFFGFAPALLVLAGVFLVLALLLLWFSLGELTNEDPLTLEEALELAAPERREQEKLSILRGLKDLDQEHRFGKISDAEFAAESERLRHQARRVLSSLDDSVKTRRTSVEGRIARFLASKQKREGQAGSGKPGRQGAR